MATLSEISKLLKAAAERIALEQEALQQEISDLTQALEKATSEANALRAGLTNPFDLVRALDDATDGGLETVVLKASAFEKLCGKTVSRTATASGVVIRSDRRR